MELGKLVLKLLDSSISLNDGCFTIDNDRRLLPVLLDLLVVHLLPLLDGLLELLGEVSKLLLGDDVGLALDLVGLLLSGKLGISLGELLL